MMKNLAFLALMALFAANTVVTFAWAKPCVPPAGMEMAGESRMAHDGSTPCHDEREDSSQEHCEGLCLCQHVASSQIPVAGDAEVLRVPDRQSQRRAGARDNMTSRKTAPPRRPPRALS